MVVFLLLAALAWAAAWLLRRFSSRWGARFGLGGIGVAGASPIRHVARSSLPGGIACHLVEAQGSRVLITVSRHGVTSLLLGAATPTPAGVHAMKRLWLPLALLAFTGVAFGAEPAASVTAPLTITLDAGAKSGAVSDALRIVMLLTLLAVLPAILIAMTSFTRTIIVLSMLRHAFGMQDTPPNMVLVSLALFLTLFTMAPAFQAAYRDGIRPMADNQITMESAVTQTVKPLREFMIRQTREKDLALILEIARVEVPDSIDEVSTIHIIPAFLSASSRPRSPSDS